MSHISVNRHLVHAAHIYIYICIYTYIYLGLFLQWGSYVTCISESSSRSCGACIYTYIHVYIHIYIQVSYIYRSLVHTTELCRIYQWVIISVMRYWIHEYTYIFIGLFHLWYGSLLHTYRSLSRIIESSSRSCSTACCALSGRWWDREGEVKGE